MTALMDVFKEFAFEAAHSLPNLPASHKCACLHGHSFRAKNHVRGDVGAESRLVVDFADIKRVFAPLLDQLDRSFLNEVDGFSNPTSEKLARWIWRRLLPTLPDLVKIVSRETCTSGCVFQGEDR